MSKLVPTMNIRPSGKPYMVKVSTPYRPDINVAFKFTPGAAWSPMEKVWLFPVEMKNRLKEIAVEFDFKYADYSPRPGDYGCDFELAQKLNPAVKDYQYKTVFNVFHNHGDSKWMVNYEMGLGKSLTAIEALRYKQTCPILIVCPANVRLNWIDELKKWWPDHPEAKIYESSKVLLKDETHPPITIVSYELLPKLIEKFTRFEGIVIDESHYAKNSRVARSKAVASILMDNPNAVQLALTATPISNEPSDLWHQLECLWPGRFGTFFQFCKAYCNSRTNEYASSGLEFYGANPERAKELEERLKAVSSRVTKKEVAHLLPPFTVDTKRIRAKTKIDYRELMVQLKDPMRQHENKLENWCKEAGEAKFDYAREFVQQAVEGGKTHICLLTHFIDSANKLGELLRADGHPVTVVTGKLAPAKRHGVLAEAKAAPTSILVATMHSVVEGIDLTPYTHSIFVELYWQPKVMIQTLGRFHRWTSKEKGYAQILVLEGTLEEKIAHVLEQKIKDMNSIIEGGASETQMSEALSNTMSDDEFLAELRKAAKSQYADDEYM